MSNEKKSVSEDNNMTDYANLAFNPYATSTDDLTFSTFGNGEPTKNGKSMENGGFEPEHFVEKNPHYEDTAEVIEKAGLGGTGRRKKENIVYEAAGLKKKPKPSEKLPEPPQLRASNIPPRPAEDWRGISKDKNNTRWKLPFLILCTLFLICLVGAAFGVIAYLRDESCSCSSNSSPIGSGPTAPQTGGIANDTSAQQIAELKNSSNMINTELEMMKAMFHELERTQTMQKEELTKTNASVIFVHRQLNSAIQTVNATFNMKLQNVNNSISSLSGDVEKLRNVSKQMGPRGFNGTQGPQGLPGPQGLVGAPGVQGPKGERGANNISECRVNEKFQKGLTANNLEKLTVSHEAVAGWKVMSAVCTTEKDAGTIHTVLSQSNNIYTCTCAGESTYSLFKPIVENKDGDKQISCGIIYWECPEHT